MARLPENHIKFPLTVDIEDVRNYQYDIKNKIEFRGFDKIVLDFSSSNVAFPESMLPIIVFCRMFQAEGVRFYCILPEDSKLSSLFLNANWAHLIDPKHYDASTRKIQMNIPAREFRNLDEQVGVVNELIDSTLSVLLWAQREHLSALEWALNEIVDNTLTHSQSAQGGIVQLSLHPRTKDIEVVVADSGVGIPESLRTLPIYSELDDLMALQSSLKEGVTRGTGQGNGLFGSSQISALSGGRFHVNSGKAYIALSRDGKSKQQRCLTAIFGTSIVFTINASTPLLLENSLKMGGRPFQHTDFVEIRYDVDEYSVPFRLREETKSVGSRAAGKEVRNKINFLMQQFPDRRVEVDAEGAGVFSSSFADEAFAKLQIELGKVGLTGKLRIQNLSALNQQLISRSVAQRQSEI